MRAQRDADTHDKVPLQAGRAGATRVSPWVYVGRVRAAIFENARCRWTEIELVARDAG